MDAIKYSSFAKLWLLTRDNVLTCVLRDWPLYLSLQSVFSDNLFRNFELFLFFFSSIFPFVRPMHVSVCVLSVWKYLVWKHFFRFEFPFKSNAIHLTGGILIGNAKLADRIICLCGSINIQFGLILSFRTHSKSTVCTVCSVIASLARSGGSLSLFYFPSLCRSFAISVCS